MPLELLCILSAIISYFSAYEKRMREGEGGKHTFLGITTTEGLGKGNKNRFMFVCEKDCLKWKLLVVNGRERWRWDLRKRTSSQMILPNQLVPSCGVCFVLRVGWGQGVTGVLKGVWAVRCVLPDRIYPLLPMEEREGTVTIFWGLFDAVINQDISFYLLCSHSIKAK